MSSAIGAGCPVCLSTLRIDDAFCVSTCGHTFHETCIKTWVATSHSCPLCRKSCFNRDIVRLYLQMPGDSFISQFPGTANTSTTNENDAYLMAQNEKLQTALAEVRHANDRRVAELAAKSAEIASLKFINDRQKNENQQFRGMQTRLQNALAEIRVLRNSVTDMNRLRDQLNDVTTKLRISELYSHLMAGEPAAGEADELTKLASACALGDCEPLLRSQRHRVSVLKDAAKNSKILSNSLNSEVSSLRRKLADSESTVKRLSDQLRDRNQNISVGLDESIERLVNEDQGNNRRSLGFSRPRPHQITLTTTDANRIQSPPIKRHAAAASNAVRPPTAPVHRANPSSSSAASPAPSISPVPSTDVAPALSRYYHNLPHRAGGPPLTSIRSGTLDNRKPHPAVRPRPMGVNADRQRVRRELPSLSTYFNQTINRPSSDTDVIILN